MHNHFYSLCSFWDGWAAGKEQVRFTILEGMEMMKKKKNNCFFFEKCGCLIDKNKN
ncbi:MAG: hypothetical protein UH103_08240 [Paludibacteraceae bacterium]|nr:hypothetical protein [Paludibacteraceae bacterium]